MNDDKENLKVKLNLDNLPPKAENKTGTQNPPPLNPDTGSFLKDNIGLKLKSEIQEVKLKVKLPQAEKKNIVLPQTQKTDEQTSSNAELAGNSALNIVNNQKEKTQKIVLKKESSQKPVINLDEINIKSQEEKPSGDDEEAKKTYFDNFEVVPNGHKKQNISDTVKLQLKPKTASSSAFSGLTSEEKPQAEILAKEDSSKAQIPGNNFTDKNINKPAKKNTKYIYLAAALIIMLILLYFLISTIKTLMTI